MIPAKKQNETGKGKGKKGELGKKEDKVKKERKEKLEVKENDKMENGKSEENMDDFKEDEEETPSKEKMELVPPIRKRRWSEGATLTPPRASPLVKRRRVHQGKI